MDETTVHVAQPGQTSAACGADDGEVILLDEALSGDGRHFNCGACMTAIRGGQAHASAPEPEQ